MTDNQWVTVKTETCPLLHLRGVWEQTWPQHWSVSLSVQEIRCPVWSGGLWVGQLSVGSGHRSWDSVWFLHSDSSVFLLSVCGLMHACVLFPHLYFWFWFLLFTHTYTRSKIVTIKQKVWYSANGELVLSTKLCTYLVTGGSSSSSSYYDHKDNNANTNTQITLFLSWPRKVWSKIKIFFIF